MLLLLVLAQIFLVSLPGDEDAQPPHHGGQWESSGTAPALTLCLALRVKICEELLRFAVYNCMSIDTDKNTWD